MRSSRSERETERKEVITLMMRKVTTKVSRTKSLRIMQKSSRPRRAIRNSERILSRSLGS